MSDIGPSDVRVFITSFLQQRLAATGHNLLDGFPEDFDLLLSGTIDSLGLLELITAVTRHYGREIDFEALDPEQMTVVGPFCKFVSDQIRNG